MYELQITVRTNTDPHGILYQINEDIKDHVKEVYAKEAIQVLEQAEEKKDIDGILAVMTQHRDSTEVQEQGCHALGNLTQNPANRRTIAEKGGIDVILAAMKQHPDSTGVQQYGCLALVNVAAWNDANQRTIAEKGGIEAAFRAMTQHSHHEGVQQWGCFMMCCMVECESARPAIREGKALMDAARKNFPNNFKIRVLHWRVFNPSKCSIC